MSDDELCCRNRPRCYIFVYFMDGTGHWNTSYPSLKHWRLFSMMKKYVVVHHFDGDSWTLMACGVDNLFLLCPLSGERP